VLVGSALEWAALQYGDSPLHLVATGLLLGGVVTFLPDGVLPALAALAARLSRHRAASIREVDAAGLLAAEAESTVESTVDDADVEVRR
jgi:branched-chain amino acid transport system permease protein